MSTPRVLAALSLAVASLVAGCAEEQISPFDPARLGQAQRSAARDQSTAEMKQLPTTYKSWETVGRPGGGSRARRNEQLLPRSADGKIVTGHEPTYSITLADAIKRNVANNLDVRAAGYSPGIDSARIIEAQARFDPVLFANGSADITNRRTGGSSYTDPRFIGTTQQSSVIIDRNRETVFTGQAGVRQVLENGAQIEISEQIRQTDGNPNNFILDPYREADLVLQITQPLLRDFGEDVNRARIDIARNNAEISVLDFRKALEDSIDKTEEVYWALADAQNAVNIQLQRVQGAEDTADVVSKRLAVDQSQLQLAQAAAEAESRRAALTAARARVRDLSDQLKQLMNDPEFPTASATVLVAESNPLDQSVRFDLDDMIDTALQHRLEIGQQFLRVGNADITLRAAKNNLLPQLNLQGKFNPMGLGPQFDDSIDSQSDFNKLSYSIGLQFELPLGNREARAIYRRSLLQRMQTITQYQSLTESISLEVRQQSRQVETSWEQLRRFRAARFSREQALRAIIAQELAATPLTPGFIDLKLRTQDFLAEAQLAESQSLASYNIAISKLEKAKGTILKYNNITMDERGVRRQMTR